MSERKAVVVYPESLRVEVMDWSVAAKKFPGKETKMEKLVRKIVTNDGVIVIDFTYIIVNDKISKHVPSRAISNILREIAPYIPKRRSGKAEVQKSSNKPKQRRYWL